MYSQQMREIRFYKCFRLSIEMGCMHITGSQNHIYTDFSGVMTGINSVFCKRTTFYFSL